MISCGHASRALAALAFVLATAVSQAANACDAGRDRNCAVNAMERGDYATAAEAAAEFLEYHSGDFEMRWLRAQALLRADEPELAAAEFTRLAAMAPGDADVHYGLGLSLLNSGEPAQAAEQFATARGLAPQNEDAWRMELAALEQLEGHEADRRRAQLVAEARVRFPQAGWHARVPARAGKSMVVAAAEHSELSGSAGNWSELALGGAGGQGRAQWSGGLRSVERFDLRDSELSAAFDWAFSPQWTAGAEAAWAPDAEVLARWIAGASVNYRLRDPTTLSMSLRRLAFDGPEVTLGVLGAENYWESYRAAYRLYASRLDGATGVSHSLQLGRYFESGQLSLALSYGDEIESLGNGQVLRTKSTVVALAGAILIDGRNELLCEAGWQDLDTLYERLWLRLGLRRRW